MPWIFLEFMKFSRKRMALHTLETFYTLEKYTIVILLNFISELQKIKFSVNLHLSIYFCIYLSIYLSISIYTHTYTHTHTHTHTHTYIYIYIYSHSQTDIYFSLLIYFYQSISDYQFYQSIHRSIQSFVLCKKWT